MELLKEPCTPKRIRRALEKLPERLGDAYDNIMDRIDRQEGDKKTIALTALMWITHAKRRLTVDELAHAIALGLEPDCTAIGSDDLIDVDLLLSSCAGLVTLNNEYRIIRLVHYTTQDYLEKRLMDRKGDIARGCLTYLCLDVFDDFRDKDSEVKDRAQKYELSRYAAQYWGVHTRGELEKDPHIQGAVLSLLASGNKKDSMLQLETYANSGWGDIFFTRGQTLLHVIAKNGLATICERVLYGRINGKDTYALEVDI